LWVIGVSKASESSIFRLNRTNLKLTNTLIKANFSKLERTKINNHLQLKIRVSAFYIIIVKEKRMLEISTRF
jgi:hypothetical protein